MGARCWGIPKPVTHTCRHAHKVAESLRVTWKPTALHTDGYLSGGLGMQRTLRTRARAHTYTRTRIHTHTHTHTHTHKQANTARTSPCTMAASTTCVGNFGKCANTLDQLAGRLQTPQHAIISKSKGQDTHAKRNSKSEGRNRPKCTSAGGSYLHGGHPARVAFASVRAISCSVAYMLSASVGKCSTFIHASLCISKGASDGKRELNTHHPKSVGHTHQP